jgi:hypothetical protein
LQPPEHPDCLIDDHSLSESCRRGAGGRWGGKIATAGGAKPCRAKRPLDPIRRTAQSDAARNPIAPVVAEETAMHRFAALAVAAFAAIAGLVTFGGTARAWDDLEATTCDDPGILLKIEDRFRHQAFMVHHLPNLRISELRGIHEHRYLPYREDRPIARRYCGATAELSDGHHRTIWYLIEDRMGLAGIGDNVEFCISGFDRWFVYNGHCRILR